MQISLKTKILFDETEYVFQIWSMEDGMPTAIKLDGKLFIREDKVKNLVQLTLDEIEGTNIENSLTEVKDDNILVASNRRYHYVTIYRDVLDFILKECGDCFFKRDVSNVLKKFYKNNRGKVLSDKTLEVYANAYRKYMLDNFLVLEYDHKRLIKNNRGVGKLRRLIDRVYEYRQQKFRQKVFTVDELEDATGINKHRLMGVLAELNKIKAVKIYRNEIRFLMSREDAHKSLSKYYRSLLEVKK